MRSVMIRAIGLAIGMLCLGAQAQTLSPNCRTVYDAAGGAMRGEEERHVAMKNPIDQAIQQVQDFCYGTLRNVDTLSVFGISFSGFLNNIINTQVNKACNDLLGKLYQGKQMTDLRQILPGGGGVTFNGGAFSVSGVNIGGAAGTISIPGVQLPNIPGVASPPLNASPPAPAAAANCPAGLAGLLCRNAGVVQ